MPQSITPPNADNIPDDPHVQQIAEGLQEVFTETQQYFFHSMLILERDRIRELARILADFAIDLHKDLGLWKAYESYSWRFFDTALPLTPSLDPDDRAREIDWGRIHHLLWILYPEMKEGLILSPRHKDLEHLANAAAGFLQEEVSSLPEESPVKDFLSGPNTYGWDVKRKLIWLGTGSYMFRPFYQSYMQEYDEKELIAATDDFLCQQCTPWLGLGAIDILPEMLDVSEQDRRDIRSWYERHLALYEVLRGDDDTIGVRNLINDRRYTVRMNAQDNPYEAGMFVFGSLVPWRGEWYWSGTQRLYQDAPREAVEALEKQLKRDMPQVVCRYCEDYERETRRQAKEFHGEMLDRHGTDLVYYPDGLSMAADWQKEIRLHNESRRNALGEAGEEGEESHRADISVPDELLESSEGIGVFFNPEEGREVMTRFDALVSGMKKGGENLTRAENSAVFGFIFSESISPRFVRRMVEQYGPESILSVWKLPTDNASEALEFLLRSWKGQFFRKRYPALSLLAKQ